MITHHSLSACPGCVVQPLSARAYRSHSGNQCRISQTASRLQASRNGATPLVGPEKYGWRKPSQRCMPGRNNVEEVTIADIRRPLQGTRSNDAEKVQALMESIEEVGLLEPIDVLLVEGKYYGFSGCHRFEACQRLGHEKILAKIRKANRQILQMHFR